VWQIAGFAALDIGRRQEKGLALVRPLHNKQAHLSCAFYELQEYRSHQWWERYR